jgi:dGTPase
VSRRLALNEDLTEAIALSHDLGHPPFGHAGEDTLNECLKDHSGFDHNLHALRVVELLEERYPDFPGLNLSWEVREAFVHHAKSRTDTDVQQYLAAGSPLLEAQVVDATDSLTYDTHDIDDALGLGLITLDDLDAVPFWRRAAENVRRTGVTDELFRTGVVRHLIDWQVRDLVAHSLDNLKRERIRSVDDVRRHPGALIECSPDLRPLKAELERFLHEAVYRHIRVMRMKHQGRRIICSLFEEFCRHPDVLPERFARRRKDDPQERVVGDYIAGMTDRFAQQEYLRLFHPSTDL